MIEMLRTKSAAEIYGMKGVVALTLNPFYHGPLYAPLYILHFFFNLRVYVMFTSSATHHLLLLLLLLPLLFLSGVTFLSRGMEV